MKLDISIQRLFFLREEKLREVKRGDNVLRTNTCGECFANVFDDFNCEVGVMK